MDIQDEFLNQALKGVVSSPRRRALFAGGAVKFVKEDLLELLRAADLPLVPSIGKHDPKAPDVGEAMEHIEIRAYVDGCYDVGTIKLEGFTLIGNNDLAALKELALLGRRLQTEALQGKPQEPQGDAV